MISGTLQSMFVTLWATHKSAKTQKSQDLFFPLNMTQLPQLQH